MSIDIVNNIHIIKDNTFKPQNDDPSIIENSINNIYYTKLWLPLEMCHYCKRIMLPGRLAKLFNEQHRNTLIKIQMVKLDLPLHYDTYDNKPICEECFASDKLKFTCCYCGTAINGEDIKFSFGYAKTAEHLCINCYRTMPAAEWDELIVNLEKEHLYD